MKGEGCNPRHAMFLKCTRRLLVNPWAAHVCERRTVTEMVDHLVSKGVLMKDNRQREMAGLCTPLLQAVHEHEEATLKHELALLHAAPPTSLEQFRVAVLQKTRQFFARVAEVYRAQSRLASSESAISVLWPEQMGPAAVSSGLYIWGDVGIGKTMILDLFELCPTPRLAKRRMHLHSFMTMLSDRLHEVEDGQRRALLMLPPEARQVMKRPIEVVVDEIISATPILCLDEFQTFDVAHAALLAAFFRIAFERGIFLMTTSNRPPHELFHLSSTFGDFLPLMYRHCNVVHVHGIQDYRREAAARGAFHHVVFVAPNSESAARDMMLRVEAGLAAAMRSPEVGKATDRLPATGVAWDEGATMTLYGRTTIIPKRCGGVAVFEFSEICGSNQMLGPQDFQLLARDFHTIVIFNVPQIGTVAKNAAKQFIILVDELYQHKCKLFCTMCVDWQRLFELQSAERAVVEDVSSYYTEGADERSGNVYDAPCNASMEEELSFGRVLSRLHEMGSQEYLLSDHILFKITDFDVARALTV